MQIKAITFDVGGTLIEPWPSVGHVYANVAARHGFPGLDPDVLNARFRSAWATLGNFDYTRDGWRRLVDEVFREMGPFQHGVTFFPELYERFAEPDAWRVFDDVRPALVAMADSGVRLGIISNWDERLRGLLRKLRLDAPFEVIAVSCEIGFAKPAPTIFAEAARKFALPCAAILHAGDSAEMDVAGARAAGFAAVQITRHTNKRADFEIASLLDLRDHVAGHRPDKPI